VRDELHAPTALSPEKEPLLRIGSAPQLVWTLWSEEKSLASPWEPNLGRPSLSPSLNRLSYLGSLIYITPWL
jgi:hypothetical protein